MWRLLALAGVTSFALCASSRADDRPFLQRIAERTGPPVGDEHSMKRAGYPLNVKRHAVPSVTRFDQGGYVGGGSLRNNSLLARGPGSAVGPTQEGTFGTDFGGFRAHLGRVFLAPSDDPSRGHPAYLSYRTDGPRIVDVFAIRPLRNGILAKREAAEEMHHGKEEHGAGGHGAEGHAPEGSEKKGGGH